MDTSALPVNHCSQSTTFGALNRKARGTCKDGKTPKQAEQQLIGYNACTPLLMAEKKRGARHCCFDQCVLMNDAPRSVEGLLFSGFPSLNEGWRTAKPGPEHVVDPVIRGRYHGGRRPSSDDSFRSPTVIPPSALHKLNITNRYHRRRTCSHTSPRRSPTKVTLRDTRFVEC